ncbi:hypothetical protein K4F52_009149 [Lecanicillium sp. MT-2017a]|nr:hypothetical protein K4F52_009149 [Lecanicillium sp. MT-2017a]
MTRNWVAQIAHHPGATLEEIQDEPQWVAGHNHRTGYKNADNRRPGFTGEPYFEENEDENVASDAEDQFRHLQEKARNEQLINFSRQDWIKYAQRWPSNLKREAKQQQEQQDQQSSQNGNQSNEDEKNGDDESGQGDTGDESDGNGEKGEREKKQSFEDLMRQEHFYIKSLEENDGVGPSLQMATQPDLTIDEADQFSPDNWFSRSESLIRTTGSFPVNAEAELSRLFKSGLITPNDLHYVRNHGAVPRLHWEFHEIEVAGPDAWRIFSMEDLATQFETLNIPVFIACDGNRRKEMSRIKSAQGAPFGPGAVGCSYWKGPTLRDVLLAAGIEDPQAKTSAKRRAPRWINFEGADDLPEGHYSTCIPFDYAMDLRNDVILAFKMNDKPLPPDHGYPLRVVIPGYVGGRCVKWVRRIWTSEEENDSYYHLWDNRIYPAFIQSALNSVIVWPGHGEKVSLSHTAETYRVQGFAYNGSGRMIKRVEVSLDEGASWRYCFRKFPDRPIRHGNKFWTWLHWHVDIPVLDLANSKEVAVRCFDTSLVSQPERPEWNLLGMMNNGYFKVQFQTCRDEHDSGKAVLICQHPVEPGPGDGGWMQPSFENRLEQQKAESVGSEAKKKLTREEIEKHDSQEDCWIVVDGRVYDATSVLSWHPGGGDIIMAHAGRVHPKTSTEFNIVHDSYARQKLQECIIGSVTDKVANLLDRMKAEEDEEKKSSTDRDENLALKKHRWTEVKLVDKKQVSSDTRCYTFALPQGKKVLGLENGQHLQVGFHMQDKMLIRPYTPTRPLLPVKSDKDDRFNGCDQRLHDGSGTFDLTVKTYYPDKKQPGGAMSNILDTISIGQYVDIRGPSGEIVYKGRGHFNIEGKDKFIRRVSFVMGGTGITPGYSIIRRMMSESGDQTEVRVLDANNTEADILLRDEFESVQKASAGRMKMKYVLAEPPKDWTGLKGFVTKAMMDEHLFPPADDSIVLVCGPPPMIKKAVLPGLTELGFVEDENIFGF